MINVFSQWFKKYFSNPDAVVLMFLIAVILIVLTTMGNMLMPVVASVVIAYLLDGIVSRLRKYGCPNVVAVLIAFFIFLSVVLVCALGIIPLMWQQLQNFYQELPTMLSHIQTWLVQIPNKYPDYVDFAQMQHVIALAKQELAKYGQVILSFSLSSIPNVVVLVVYLILVPLLVFFFLKDRDSLMTWCQQYLPANRQLVSQVWDEVNAQIGNYIRGKIIEIIIVGIVSAIAFAIMGLQYALLLGVLVGLSVVIPYIGAVVVTIPVILIALLQWGWTTHFAYLAIVYTIIITLDANVLVPLLFSEAVDLHPVAIIVAVLFFGGLWGFWGVFFAIPLATVVKAVLNAWPSQEVAV